VKVERRIIDQNLKPAIEVLTNPISIRQMKIVNLAIKVPNLQRRAKVGRGRLVLPAVLKMKRHC